MYAPRPIKYRVSVPIPSDDAPMCLQTSGLRWFLTGCILHCDVTLSLSLTLSLTQAAIKIADVMWSCDTVCVCLSLSLSHIHTRVRAHTQGLAANMHLHSQTPALPQVTSLAVFFILFIKYFLIESLNILQQ